MNVEGSGLQAWRERILQILLYILLLFGTPAYILNLLPSIENGRILFAFFLTAAYVAVLVLAFARKSPFRFRVVSILFISYLLGPATLVLFGLSGDGRIWLMFFVIFTAIMLGVRAGLVATLLSILTYIVVGYGMLNGLLPLPEASLQANSGDPTAWYTTGGVLLLVSLILTFSSALLVQGLETSLKEVSERLASEHKLSEQLSKEHSQLEARSQDLERRVGQIRTAAEISRTMSAVLDPQELLQRVAALIQERFGLYYAGVFLLDDKNRYAELAAGTGEAGQQMITENHKLSVGGSSMVGWATANRRPRIAQNVGEEAIRFRNPHLPLTRSELALPLILGERVLGALSAQSAEENAFDDDDIAVLQNISDSLAIALENARLFQQTQSSLQEIRFLNRQYISGAWNEIAPKSDSLSVTVDSTQADTGQRGQSVSVPLTLRDEQVIGDITLEADRSTWSPDELEFIQAVSSQAALALESARLLEEAQDRAQREQTLNELTTRFARTLDFDTLIQTVVRELGQLPNVNEVSIHISPPESEAAGNGSAR